MAARARNRRWFRSSTTRLNVQRYAIRGVCAVPASRPVRGTYDGDVAADRLPLLPDYTVRRSARARRSRLTISDDGVAVVVLPMRAAEHEAADLVARHGAWIERHLARLTQRRIRLATRPSLAAGRVLTINGLAQVVRAGTAVERVALERRLRRAAKAVITGRVAVRAPELAVSVRGITIRDQRSRWGSASRRGTLSFSWRLVICPPDILDYVVVHELAHLRVAGHTAAFWRLVDRHFPASRDARRWLREHHDEIRHALD